MALLAAVGTAVGPTVGGAILSPFIQVLFDSIASRKVLDVFLGPKLSKILLSRLQIALLYVNAVLEDAEEEEVTNPIAKQWVDELKGAVYDAVDILDEIATKDLQDTRVKISMVEGIEDVLRTLELIATQKNVKGLRGGVEVRPSQRLPVTFSESDIFGRDDDKKTIINLLSLDDASGNENVRVIAIVGIGGIGKTTLAQLVYNDTAVNGRFSFREWVTVSHEFDLLRIMQAILKISTPQAYETDNLDRIQHMLTKKLKGRKFLLVLDDVWNEMSAKWEFLSNAFQHGARGSTIIVTTHNENVASTMRASKTHYLKELRYEYCRELFAKHAFPNGKSNLYPELEEIGRQIVGKCKGLPLAARTIGKLLQSKRDADQWDQLLKSELWDLPNDGRNILSTLKLSYKYLPSHLKHCFAYCSIFPKGHVFDKDQLVLLWMAEGFLQPPENKTMEEVGDEYFCDLVSRSLFQKSSGPGSGFVMHHLVHDLAIFVSGQLSLRLEGDYSKQIVDNTRHLSYLRTRFDEEFQALFKAKQLRSFLILKSSLSDVDSTKIVFHKLLSKLTCLRVLSFSSCNIELSKSISQIIHLRYLDLSSTGIKRLPKSICKLFNLQTLKLSGCVKLVKLPRNVHKLINLRHLDLSLTRLKRLPDSICELTNLRSLKLSNCIDMVALPTEIKKLTNLTYLDIIGVGIREMPIQLDSLKRLRMLTAFVVGEQHKDSIQELRKLKNLREGLAISKLQNVQHPTAVLEDMIYLKELELEWNASNSNSSESQRNDQKIVLDSLKPHTNLKNLVIKSYGAEDFPEWVGCPSFSNIASLHLENCKYCHTLPTLGQLPSLQDLSVVGFERVVNLDCWFYRDGSSSFGALKVLRFKNLPNWEEWCSFDADADAANEGGTFPQLEELCIEECPRLIRGLPFHLPSLAKLEINECPQLLATLSSAPIVREMQLTRCNDALLNDLPSGMQLLVVKGFNALQPLLERIMHPNSVLQELRIYDCSSLVQVSVVGLPSRLTALTVDSCRTLELPMHLNYTFLEKLHLTSSCDSLGSFQLDVFPKLNEIKIRGCRKLESLTAPGQYESDLVTLEIRDCPCFASFPAGGLRAPKLTKFSVANCERLTSLPDKMDIFLPSLKYLSCPQIMLPHGVRLPSQLNSDSIHINDREINDGEKKFSALLKRMRFKHH